MVRIDGRQIALFDTPAGLRASANRCPHEGYPLSEGSISGQCTLTCNWHNWKFDLDSGENLYGGDRLPVYPVAVRGDDVWVDLAEPPFEERYRALVANLRDAFDDYAYARIAREIARLVKLGADPLDVLRLAIDWSWRRLEFGWTHAYAGMADWLALYAEHEGEREVRLACLVEAVAHVAFDVLREREHAYTDDSAPFERAAFLAAIEREDEAAAVAMIRGGLAAGAGFEDFEAALSAAALAHYNDFGHALIYVGKARKLVEALGPAVMEPLLSALVRGLVFATREDKIPEFRGYAKALARWGEGREAPTAELWHGKGIDASLEAALACSAADPLTLYRALLLANARNLLRYDAAQQDQIRVSVSGNVGWLDFTHGITFAHAVREQCSRHPELWPRGLLQMACFAGRNAAFARSDVCAADWAGDDLDGDVARLVRQVIDHGLGEHIVSVHWLKTVLAARAELWDLSTEDARTLVAAVARFIGSPVKRRHTLRTAYQSLEFVARE